MRREKHQTLPTARNNHKIPYFKRMYQFIYVYSILYQCYEKDCPRSRTKEF